MPSILDHFDALSIKGLQIIPLRENSKVPLCVGWTKFWAKDFVREKLQQFPDSNIGVLLGDIIDVEGDSEEANDQINELIGDYPHPSYVSTKSIHHLFLTPDRELRHFRCGEIEFRGFGHQSVLPPSQHQGVRYKWLKSCQFPVPPMPDRLCSFFDSKRRKFRRNIKPGHTEIRCSACQRSTFIHLKRLDLELEAFRLLGSKWDCQKCRSVDLRPACRLIRSGIEKKVVLVNTLKAL